MLAQPKIKCRATQLVPPLRRGMTDWLHQAEREAVHLLLHCPVLAETHSLTAALCDTLSLPLFLSLTLSLSLSVANTHRALSLPYSLTCSLPLPSPLPLAVSHTHAESVTNPHSPPSQPRVSSSDRHLVPIQLERVEHRKVHTPAHTHTLTHKPINTNTHTRTHPQTDTHTRASLCIPGLYLWLRKEDLIPRRGTNLETRSQTKEELFKVDSLNYK